MQLKDYLKREKLDAKDFAIKAKVSLQNVYYWMRGTYKPNKFYMAILAEATNGKVTEKDWKQKIKGKENESISKDS